MTPWILDASVFLAREDPEDRNHLESRRLLEGPEALATLDLAWYEVINVAVRVWRDAPAARRLGQRLGAVADDGGLVRGDPALLAEASRLAVEHGISVYDAAYVAAARRVDGRLVSCDERDLVSKGLACLPAAARSGEPGAV